MRHELVVASRQRRLQQVVAKIVVASESVRVARRDRRPSMHAPRMLQPLAAGKCAAVMAMAGRRVWDACGNW